VAEHFDGIPTISPAIRKDRDYCSFGVIAERLIDLVTDYEFGHGESFRLQALRPVRSKCGFFAIGKAGTVKMSDEGHAKDSGQPETAGLR
jgi:hypothetical protein